MRGEISTDSFEKIKKALPKLPDGWLDITFPEQSTFLLNDLYKNETTHISVVCLYDAFRRAESALDCLFECYACLKWFREEGIDIKTESREFFAVYYGKFYAEYNYLFLYAIGEDIAEFVLTFLTKESEFKIWLSDPVVDKKLRKKKIASNAAKVGVFMAEQYSGNNVTKAILKLRDNDSWNKAMKYRNRWVHEKPPIIEGLGIQYNRKSKIFDDNGAKGFGLGTWSSPDFGVEEIIKTAHDATRICIEVLSDLLRSLKSIKSMHMTLI